MADPNTDSFPRQWQLLGARNSAPKKLKEQFFSKKKYILERLMHITSLLSYTLQIEEMLNLVVLLNFPNVAKASTHWYMHTLYRSPAAFYVCLITEVIALLHTTNAKKNFLYCPLNGVFYCLNLNSSMHFRAGSKSPVIFKMTTVPSH